MKLDKAVKEFERKKHNEKVDRRRKKLKKLGKGLKKAWNYLSETELAKQNKKKDNGRYRFENHKW